MKPRRSRPEKKVGQRNPRIHSWKPGRFDAATMALAELKAVKATNHKPRRAP
jgi:hypothetical protein